MRARALTYYPAPGGVTPPECPALRSIAAQTCSVSQAIGHTWVKRAVRMHDSCWIRSQQWQKPDTAQQRSISLPRMRRTTASLRWCMRQGFARPWRAQMNERSLTAGLNCFTMMKEFLDRWYNNTLTPSNTSTTSHESSCPAHGIQANGLHRASMNTARDHLNPHDTYPPFLRLPPAYKIHGWASDRLTKTTAAWK